MTAEARIEGQWVDRQIALSSWMPVAAGLVLLYVPTYLSLGNSFWRYGQGVHGPLFLAICTWLVWRSRTAFRELGVTAIGTAIGWALVVLATVMYAIGRSQDFVQLEVMSQSPLLAGVVLVLIGPKACRRLWFPLLFLNFIVPVPGSMLDAILVPLKELVSSVVAHSLYSMGLPVARDGVLLYIGPYRLLIADACSGLNSLVALSAVGLLYVYLAGYRQWLPRVLLLLLVVPVAFVANIVRVSALVLTTYYRGDAAGQSLHDYASYSEILIAFGAFFLIDSLLRRSFASARTASGCTVP